MEDYLTSGSARLDQEPAANVIEQKRPERLMKTLATRQDIYGWMEDGRQSRISYRQRTAHDQEKSSTSKHGVQCQTQNIDNNCFPEHDNGS
jgi:hypothetical protein